MIKPNTTITLRPYKTYKDNPDHDVPYIERVTPMGRALYFQGLDHNRDPVTQKVATGFYNVCILTNQRLGVGDKVVVKSIVGAKMFRMKRVLLITILEVGEKPVNPVGIEGFDMTEVDF